MDTCANNHQNTMDEMNLYYLRDFGYGQQNAYWYFLGRIFTLILIISTLQKLCCISGHWYTFRLFPVEIPYPYSHFFFQAVPVPVSVPKFPDDSVSLLFPDNVFQVSSVLRTNSVRTLGTEDGKCTESVSVLRGMGQTQLMVTFKKCNLLKWLHKWSKSL